MSRHSSSRSSFVSVSGLSVTLLLLLTVAAGAAQDVALQTVTGRVLNATSGAPVARVLVQFGSAAAFTDHDGRFALSDAPTSGGALMLTKPGYFTTPEHTDGSGVQVTAAQLAQPLELRLYPEALLTGTVVGQDGAPLSRIQVTARRLTAEDGVRRFETITSAETDAHGAFRLTVPAGDYQVTTQFVAAAPETGLSVLPAVTPPGSGGGTFHLSSGEQQQLELHARTGVAHTVTLSLQGTSDERRTTLTLSTANGATWRMGGESRPDSGETALHLPAGAYHLSIISASPDSIASGEARLTVPDHDLSGITVQLAPVAPLSIEVNVDGHASGTATAPSPQELGLQLVPEQPESAGRHEGAIRLQTRPGHGPVFLPSAGRFRLVATPRNAWYVESATYGGTEILGQAITVAPGSGAAPISLTVNNVMGSLDGKLTPGKSAWVDLLPSFPTATPVISTRAGSDGSFSFPSLPPGNYLATALEHRTTADVQDPAVSSRLGLRVQPVVIQAGTNATLELELPASGSGVP